MMTKEMLIAIGAGILSAFAAMAFLGRLPGTLFLVYLAALPLFMAGLSTGPRAAAIGGGAGFMTAGLLGGGMGAGVFGLMQALPAWLVVRQTLLQKPGGGPGGQVDWYPVGNTLCWLAVLASALLALAALITGLSAEGGFMGTVNTNLDRILEAIAPNLEAGRRTQMVGLLTPMFPGAAGTSWVVMTVVNATLAQGILVRMGRNLRPSPAYVDLRLPQWMSWPLVASAALALLGSGDLEYTGRSLSMILAVPYFFLGLAVVHTWAHRVSFTGMLLVSFYLVLVVSGWATLVVTGIGVLEQWGGLRGRFAGPSKGGPPAGNE